MVKVFRSSRSLLAAALCLAATLHFGALPADSQLNYRNPVVLSIAPDVVNCDDPDDPDNVEDVQIAGICFLGTITSAFLTTSPDGSGTQIPLSNVVHVASNVITATVPIAQLAPNTPYFVFVVRGYDGKRSTSYPNAFGFDVTFTCTDSIPPVPPSPSPLTACRVVRTSEGKFVLQVDGIGFVVGVTRVFIGDTPCRKNKYPKRYVNPSSNTTTRITCHDNIRRLLPAIVTVELRPGVFGENSLNCTLP